MKKNYFLFWLQTTTIWARGLTDEGPKGPYLAESEEDVKDKIALLEEEHNEAYKEMYLDHYHGCTINVIKPTKEMIKEAGEHFLKKRIYATVVLKELEKLEQEYGF